MKITLKILLLFLVIPFYAHSQNKKSEFEGIIKYNHKVIAKDSAYNVEYDYSAIGKKSDYYYKKGNCKFVNYDSYFKGDLFKSKEFMDYLLINGSDTVFCLDARVTDIEVIDFNIKKSVDTILNYTCNLITLKLKPIGQDYPVSYRRYYYSEKLPINPDHFKGCKNNAYDLIFGNAKSLPLRIEFEWPNRTIIWEAYEVIKQDVKEETFQLDKNWVLKKMN